jgi:hypothetical protein
LQVERCENISGTLEFNNFCGYFYIHKCTYEIPLIKSGECPLQFSCRWRGVRILAEHWNLIIFVDIFIFTNVHMKYHLLNLGNAHYRSVQSVCLPIYKLNIKLYKHCNLTCFILVWNVVFCEKELTQIEGVWEQSSEENIWM